MSDVEYKRDNDPTEVSIITIKKYGNKIFTEIDHVENYPPVPPESMIGACSSVIKEYSEHVIGRPLLDEYLKEKP